MNSFIYVLPWATPAPIGLILGTGISLLAVVLAVVLIVVDGIVYLPFIKAYDATLLEEENLIIANKGSEDLIKDINKALAEFIKSDKYQELKTKWGA